MNDSEIYMNSIANTFTKEPVFNCPQCNTELQTDWVDNGFGPYSVQASPYGCECGWHETGCKECIKEKCFSWAKCQGRALINVNPASGITGVNNMLQDPNVKAEQATEEVAATESAAQDTAMEVTESEEEGNTEG